MTYLELQKSIKTPTFTFLDVLKFFPDELDSLVRMQLYRFAKRGLIIRIKRELYCFSDVNIDELDLPQLIYSPSYITLETALNYHGIIPDIPPGGVTCVSPVTTRKFVTPFGRFYYRKINKKLFWGYSEGPYKMAFPEKALLDYIYYHGLKTAEGLRIDWRNINSRRYREFNKQYRRSTLKWMLNARKKYFEENHWVRVK